MLCPDSGNEWVQSGLFVWMRLICLEQKRSRQSPARFPLLARQSYSGTTTGVLLDGLGATAKSAGRGRGRGGNDVPSL